MEQTDVREHRRPTPTGPSAGGYPELSQQVFYYDEPSRLRRTDAKFFKNVAGSANLRWAHRDCRRWPSTPHRLGVLVHVHRLAQAVQVQTSDHLVPQVHPVPNQEIDSN